MEHIVEKVDKETQTDYAVEEEIFLPRLDDGTIISYECEDPFLQDYMNSYYKWLNDGERFLKAEFVKEYISTGKIPILKDGRPEMEEWFNYTITSGIFFVEWGTTRILAKEFIEKMLKVYNEHGNIPDYLSTNSQIVIQSCEWYPQY